MWSLHCSLNLIISVWNTYSGFSVFPGPWIIRHLTENDMVCLFLTVLERLQNKNDKLRPTFFQCKALSELRSLFKTKQKNKQTKKSLNISPIVAIGSMYYNIKPNFDTSSGERITKLSFLSTEGLLIRESQIHWNNPIPGFQDSIFKSVMNFQVPLTFVSAKA